MRDRPLLLGSLGVVVAASGFGLLGPLARAAYGLGFDPLTFVAWRASFGLLVVLAFVAARTRRGIAVTDPRRLSGTDRLALLVAGLSSLSLNVAMFFAFGLGSIAIPLLAFYTYPGFVALVAAVLGHERLDGGRIAALVLALAGMVLVVTGGLSGDAGAAIHPLAVVLGLAAAACQTVFVTISRSRYAAVPAEQVTAWILMVAAGGCAILAALGGGPLGVIVSRPEAFGLAAISGLLAAGIPSILFLVGIRTIGGTRAGILMLFEPLVGVTLAALLLHEALTPPQLVGGAAILAAALLVQRGARGEAGVQIEPAGVPSVEHG